MPSPRVITAKKRNGFTCFYMGMIGDDGWIYFNDQDYYRFKDLDKDPSNVYVKNESRFSWTKTSIFDIVDGTSIPKSSIQSYPIAGGAGATAPTGESVEAAVQWAMAIARSDLHGYDQGNRWGPDYDCSSLVYEAFRVGGGFALPVHSGYTGSMIGDFTKLGFVWHAGLGNASSECLRGDILLDIDAHVEIYLGNEMNVGAHVNEFGGIVGGRTGDQTGREISIGGYYAKPWDGLLRYGE